MFARLIISTIADEGSWLPISMMTRTRPCLDAAVSIVRRISRSPAENTFG